MNHSFYLNKNKQVTTKWEDISCWWIGGLSIVKMSVMPNVIYRFDAISVKSPKTFFFLAKIEKAHPTIHTESQRTPNCQKNPEKEKQS